MKSYQKPNFINSKRRGFIQGSAVAAGTVASGVALADHSPGGTRPSEAVAKVNATGYRRTAHVDRYYARARF